MNRHCSRSRTPAPASPLTRAGLVLATLLLASACAALLAASADTRPAAAGANLLTNGDFEQGRDGKPADWGLAPGATWEADGANHFLRLAVAKPGDEVMVYRAVQIPADVKALELSYRVRYEGIRRGKQNWYDGRIMMNFKDADGAVVKPGPGAPSFQGSSAQWKERSQQFLKPAGANKLELMFTLFRPESGQLDFDDVRLTPVSADALIAAESAARARNAARIAALPKPRPQVPVARPDQMPKELHVVGNELQTMSGQPVWLQGVAIPSLEWSGGGDHVLESIAVAIDQWKANCIRLPVRENFWAGVGPYQNDGGMKYRQLIDDAVNACAARGAYLVLDLHDFRAPEQRSLAFWKEAAAKYKNHPAVLLELFNEPHDITWDVWRNGGEVTDRKTGSGAAVENKEKLASFKAVGMQQLLEAIRAQGARNVVIAGGLDWGYDLSGILKGSALSDPGGNGVVYSSHVYPWKSGWQHDFIDVAAKYPLFLGEVGADVKRMDFIPADRQEDPATWVPDMLGVIQKYKLNWTAWCFHPSATPRLILDWKYTPTPFWGVPVKKALAGEKFETKRLR